MNRAIRRAGRVGGFTVVELLVVLCIITLVLGLSAGVYFSVIRLNAVQAEAGAVQSIISAARMTAVDEGAETFVCIDTEKGSLYPFVRRKMAVWHLETLEESPTRSPGAFGYAAVSTGTGSPTVVDGKVGKAVQFDGTSYLTCKMLRDVSWVNVPTLDAREGVGFEAFIMPVDTADTPQTILSRDGWWRVQLAANPGPVGAKSFSLQAEIVTLNADGAGYIRRTVQSGYVIRPNEWTHIRVGAHKFSTMVAIEINGAPQVPATSGSASAAAPDAGAETVLAARSGGTEAFHGRLDEVIFSAYAVDDAHQISRKLKLAATGLADGNTIRFDATGRLDAVHDGTPPKVMIKDERGGGQVDTCVTITVGTMGALNVQQTSN